MTQKKGSHSVHEYSDHCIFSSPLVISLWRWGYFLTFLQSRLQAINLSRAEIWTPCIPPPCYLLLSDVWNEQVYHMCHLRRWITDQLLCDFPKGSTCAQEHMFSLSLRVFPQMQNIGPSYISLSRHSLSWQWYSSTWYLLAAESSKSTFFHAKNHFQFILIQKVIFQVFAQSVYFAKH